jgi:hypothetical protein
MLREMMASTRAPAATSAALLLAHVVIETLFRVGTVFGLQKSISRFKSRTR